MPDPASAVAVSPASDFSPNFGELLQKLDKEFENLSAKTLERFCFCLDGLNFDVRCAQQESGYRFLVTATMGYMPFSIESDERREAIKTIIISTRSLPNVRFGVDTSSRVSASALFEMERIVAPDFIFYPLILFMQEARPFIQLIGKYLIAPTPALKAKTENKAG
jgi:hypothetical protein